MIVAAFWGAAAGGVLGLLGLFFGGSRGTRSAGGLVALLGLFLALLCGLAAIVPRRVSNERNAAATLQTAASAQSYFREFDVDRNGVKDYWRADIAGLYTVNESKLIEITLALADERPASDLSQIGARAPKARYWFRALRFADEKQPDPERWAACAIPEDPRQATFLITHEGPMYMRKGRHALELVPSPAALKRDWGPPVFP